MQRGADGAGSEQKDERHAASWRLGQQYQQREEEGQQEQHPSVSTTEQARRRRPHRQGRAAECRYAINASARTTHCRGFDPIKPLDHCPRTARPPCTTRPSPPLVGAPHRMASSQHRSLQAGMGLTRGASAGHWSPSPHPQRQ